MKFTNKKGLPKQVFEAVTKDNYTGKKNDLSVISATTLISPPKIRLLKIRHDDEIEEDAMDNVWRLLGNAVHHVVSNVSEKDRFIEERVNVEILGKTISAQPDIYDATTKSIDDYKVTSAWSLCYSPDGKKEWEQQLNIYAYLFSSIGFSVERINIVAILRDWSEKKTGGDYPPSPIIVMPYKLWTEREQFAFISGRIELHKSFEDTPDDQIPECSPEERWKKEDIYAVYKKENKTATKLFKTLDEAEAFATSLKGNTRVEFRKGEDTRCHGYCSVNRFCHYYKQNYGTPA